MRPSRREPDAPVAPVLGSVPGVSAQPFLSLGASPPPFGDVFALFVSDLHPGCCGGAGAPGQLCAALPRSKQPRGARAPGTSDVCGGAPEAFGRARSGRSSRGNGASPPAPAQGGCGTPGRPAEGRTPLGEPVLSSARRRAWREPGRRQREPRPVGSVGKAGAVPVGSALRRGREPGFWRASPPSASGRLVLPSHGGAKLIRTERLSAAPVAFPGWNKPGIAASSSLSATNPGLLPLSGQRSACCQRSANTQAAAAASGRAAGGQRGSGAVSSASPAGANHAFKS